MKQITHRILQAIYAGKGKDHHGTGIAQIVARTGISGFVVEGWILDMERIGHVRGQGCASQRRYELTDKGLRRIGEIPPGGIPVLTGLRPGRGRNSEAIQAVWTTLRQLPDFTCSQLLEASDYPNSREALDNYVYTLAGAGILVTVGRLPRDPGALRGGPGPRVYALARDIGPLAPIRIQPRGALLDPNSGITYQPSPPRLKQPTASAARQSTPAGSHHTGAIAP